MTETKGKVIIRAIPDGTVKEKVVTFISAHSGKSPPDLVRERLNRLPLVLAGSIESGRGERLAAALVALGADVVFEGGGGDCVPPLLPSSEAGSPSPAPDSEHPRTERPIRPRPATTRAGKKDLPPSPEQEKQRVAHACRIALVYALIACLVAMSSPLFYFFAVPLALYAAHRAVANLDVTIWLRCLYLPGVFVPVLNLGILALLLLQIHLYLRRSSPSPNAGKDELAQFRFVFRAGYAAIMALFLVGTAKGYLPESMSELRETIERKLEKAVARSAKDFPRKVDKDLRIDKMSAGPNKRLTFHCTLVNYPARKVDGDQFRVNITPGIVKQVCASRELQSYLGKEVIIAYAFNGSDGQPITTVNVENGDCGR